LLFTGGINAYRRALKAALSPAIRLVELDAHINDEIFARAAVDLLLESLGAMAKER
jgi:uncharacterized protein (UPF0261 family)